MELSTCCICLEYLNEATASKLVCKHSFHRECLVSHILHEFMLINSKGGREKALLNIFQSKHTFHCPLCRNEFYAIRGDTFQVDGLDIGYQENVDLNSNQVTYNFGKSVVRLTGLTN